MGNALKFHKNFCVSTPMLASAHTSQTPSVSLLAVQSGATSVQVVATAAGAASFTLVTSAAASLFP